MSEGIYNQENIDNRSVPLDGSQAEIRRRKTTKEQVQRAFSIQDDFKNRNIQTNSDESEFVNFISKFVLAPTYETNSL